MELEYEILNDKVFIFNEYDIVFLEIPLDRLTDFIEEKELNNTEEVTQEFFEERNDSGKGFNYIPIDVVVTENTLKYLQNNTKEVVKLYLENLINFII